MDALLQSFFNIEIYRQVLPYFLQGFWTTLWLSMLVIPLGVVGGLALAIVATQTQQRWLRIAVAVYVDLFRAFPPLVLLILIYFGLPFLGIEPPKLMAVAISFMLNNSSYFAEVFRAGLGSIPAGQAEAAREGRFDVWLLIGVGRQLEAEVAVEGEGAGHILDDQADQVQAWLHIGASLLFDSRAFRQRL